MSYATRALDVNGDLLIVAGRSVLLRGVDAIAQKVRSRMRMFLGEWFLNLNEGVPYFRDIFVKNPSIAVVTSVFRRVLVKTPGVASVDFVRVDLDRVRRKAHVAGSAKTDTGARLTLEPFTL